MRVVYIAGPLWSPWWPGRLWHVLRAARVAWRYWRAGWAVITPHLNSGVLSLLWPGIERRARWGEGYLAILARLSPADDLVVMLRGWEMSSGASMEFRVARSHGIEVRCEGAEAGPAIGSEPEDRGD